MIQIRTAPFHVFRELDALIGHKLETLKGLRTLAVLVNRMLHLSSTVSQFPMTAANMCLSFR